MPRTRPPYEPEFKAEAVQLFKDSGKPRSVIARDLGVSIESLRHWINQVEIYRGEREGDEREELKRLRRENRILREEREILKKAAVFFARETKGSR